MSNWYSYHGTPYKGRYPAFFDASDYKFTTAIENQYAVIKQELENYFKNQSQNFTPYFANDMYNKENGWKTSIFKFYGQENKELISHIPKLSALMNSFPEIVSYGVSVLDAHTSIAPHNGDTDAAIRCHLPIIIPASLPQCGLKVNGESRAWVEGKLILFCDAHMHEAWNLTDQKRVVLIIDALHNQNIKYRRSICKNILSLIRLHKLTVRYSFIQKAPGFVRGVIRIFLRLFV